ncbi:zinc finger protein 541-like [Manis javanica]|uniref:zinc finger protein 541-like n=1 Tax=Manis javanica TaxID=9974 RepID=UPI003C6DB4EF
MDQNSAGEEGAHPSEIHLPSFSESQGLNCSNALNQDLGPSSRDLFCAGLSGLDMDPSLPAPNVPSKVLEDNVDAFSLYSGEDRDSVKLLEKYADPESQASLQDLRLAVLQVPGEADEGGRATSGSAGKEEQHHTSPQKLLLDCSVCGKVFSSTSSRSKHYLTHSQERKHVCGICSKAFKRRDHLTRHLLTHQQTKPFACMEQGCSKSYCDDRSLRRHYEDQHGFCILKEAPPKEEACGDSSPAYEVADQPAADGLRSLVPPEARTPGPLLPNREPLRSIVSSTVHQEISSPGPVLVGASDDGEGKNTACPSPPSLGPYPCTPAAPVTLGTDVPKECHPLWKEPAAGFTAIHSREGENGGPHPAESERPPQLPPTLESWQDAVPSVDPPQDSKSKLTISNRIQDGNTYRLPDPVKEESTAGGCNQQNGGPADWAEPRSTYVCKNCSQIFYTEKGLTSHICFHSDKWLSPRRKQDQQVKARVQLPSLLCRCVGVRHGVFQASETGAEAGGGGTEPPRSLETLDGMSIAPLGTPASEPVGPGLSLGAGHMRKLPAPHVHAESLGSGSGVVAPLGSLAEAGFDRGIVPVLSRYAAPGAEPHPGGVWAVFKHCSMSTQDDSDRVIGSKLDQVDDSSGSHVIKDNTKPRIRIRIRIGKKFQVEIPELQEHPAAETSEHGASLVWKPSDDVMGHPETQDRDQVDDSSGICAIEDDTKPSIRPRIRIGREFQAEIPELQERPPAETGEQGASLVWKPSDDVMGTPEKQDRVTELCKMASSAMPGGGTNLELALHCLHEAQGDVPVALETLMHGGPQKPPTHPLADYHYAGSDVWTSQEKVLFNKAFQAHKKNFHLIHKMVQTKSVAQCVEYYYTWKKKTRFAYVRAPGLENGVKRKLFESDPTETKATCSAKKRRSRRPTPELKTETESCRGECVIATSPSAGPKRTPEPPGHGQGQGTFPCRECERVFDKIQSRNAHMRQHRLQDPVEPTVRAERPAKAFKLKEEEKEEEGELGPDMGPLQG